MSRNSTLVCTLLLVLGIFGFVAVALALPTVSGVVEFYDPTWNTMVGYTFWGCGGVTHYGYETSNYIVDNPFDSCSNGANGGDCTFHVTGHCDTYDGQGECTSGTYYLTCDIF